MGLAAQYFIIDPDDAQFRLPTGEFDVPLHLSDAMFNADGQLALDLESLKGFWGDVMLVNGRPWPVMQVQRRKYRFRVVNGCVSRSLFWRLSTNDPFQVIGTDAGLVPKPVTVTRLRHSNGERYDVVIDFSKYAAWHASGAAQRRACRTTTSTRTPIASWRSTWSAGRSTPPTTRCRPSCVPRAR